MKLVVNNRNIKYTVSLGKVTQLCGYNVPIKAFIVDSLCKHFSSEKYKEYEEILVDNIVIDGGVPGRKQWETYRINSCESMINCIMMNKSSILGKCLKECVNEFDCQNELAKMDEILLGIFKDINNRLLPGMPIEIQYTQEDLFGMIQQSSVRMCDGRDIHELDIETLLDIFIEIMGKQQEVLPEKRLYIFENLDHMVDRKVFQTFVKRTESLTNESSIWFIFTSSLDGYVFFSDESFEFINVFGDDIYCMPEYDKVIDFIRNYYPVERCWNEGEVQKYLVRIIQKISQRESLLQPEEQILLKLINESNDIKDYWKNEAKTAEIQYLEAKV